MPLPHRSRLTAPFAGCCLALSLALAGCDAGPTAPTSFAQETQGRTWVAVLEPEGLPGAETWLPFVGEADPARQRVQELQRAAGKLRRAGAAERAAELETQAGRVAAAAVEAVPGPEPMLRCVAALERWIDRAEARLEVGAHPGLERSVAQVRTLLGDARGAMQQGDTLAAVRILTRAREQVQWHTPEAVALRVIGAAEARIEGVSEPSESVRRASHLLRGAREGLAIRDYRRALRRALYALQLLDDEGIRVDAALPEEEAFPVDTAASGT